MRDDEDKERITAGALVTVVVNLKRTPLIDPSSVKNTTQSSSLNVAPSNQQKFTHQNAVVVANSTQNAEVERTEDEADENNDDVK